MNDLALLCIDFCSVRNELRMSVTARRLPELRAALYARGYAITLLCRGFDPDTYDLRAV